jgi:hypothetical protein
LKPVISYPRVIVPSCKWMTHYSAPFRLRGSSFLKSFSSKNYRSVILRESRAGLRQRREGWRIAAASRAGRVLWRKTVARLASNERRGSYAALLREVAYCGASHARGGSFRDPSRCRESREQTSAPRRGALRARPRVGGRGVVPVAKPVCALNPAQGGPVAAAVASAGAFGELTLDVKLYHSTAREAAEAILAEGFRDATGSYLFSKRRLKGVFVASGPLDKPKAIRAARCWRSIFPATKPRLHVLSLSPR